LLNVFSSAQRYELPRPGTPIVRRTQNGAADTSKAATEAGKESVEIQPRKRQALSKEPLEGAFQSRSLLLIDIVILSGEGRNSGTFLDSGAMLPEHRALANTLETSNSLMQRIYFCPRAGVVEQMDVVGGELQARRGGETHQLRD
jgi:hypothetical protein